MAPIALRPIVVACLTFPMAMPCVAFMRPLKNSRIVTFNGTVTPDGTGCRFRYSTIVNRIKPTHAGIQKSNPRFANGVCEIDFEIGEPDDVDVQDEKERQERLATAQSVEAHEAAGYRTTPIEMKIVDLSKSDRRFSTAYASGFTRAWVTDPINIEVTSLRTDLSYAYDNTGNEVYNGSASCSPNWFTTSGWQKNYQNCFMDDGRPWSVESVGHVEYSNPIFCAGNTTYNSYNTIRTRGTAYEIRFSYDVTMWGGCTSLLTIQWIGLCNPGSCP